MKKFTLLCTTILLAALALNTVLTRGLMSWFNTPSVTRAEISGKDGELIVTDPNTIVNKYGILAVNAPAGSSQISFNNPGGPNGLDISTLAAGDLIMVIQMSGASIDTSNTSSYGLITNLNNAGRHEFITVNKVIGNTITINPPCGGLRFSYTASAKVQIIRVPQYTKLTINSGASLTAPAWNGTIGGIVVVDVQNNAIINGNIDVSSLGFRGGALSGAGGGGLRTDYVTNQQDFGAEKGEGIAGFQADYDLAGGRYGRGAAANAGGGGTAHNTAGGGGANGSNGKAWTGQGVMDGATTGAAAWALDPGYIANGNALTDSSGGGRGGYSYAVNNGNALTQGPGNAVWGGDNRREVGGLGGRPVAQDTTGRIFLGGGGGAGAQNNDAGGAGGRGGGLIYIIADTVTGTGTLLANGANGGNTRNENRDGAGGAGAGGTIVVAAKTSLTGSIAAQANGGVGGNQAPPVAPFDPESEGIGGGGGGGFIAFSNGALITQVNGGANGLSQAPSISEFPANGATRGATGQAIPSVAAIPFCSTTSDLSITKTNNAATAVPGAPTTYAIVVRNNGPNDVFGVPVTDTLPAVLTNGSWTCTPSAGSACAAATGIGSINTTVNLINGGTATFNLTVTPDPSATGMIANTATVAMPDGAVDPNPNNNSASDTDTLTPQADLSINKTDGSSTAIAGTDLTYTITVRNNGPSTVNGAAVTDIVTSKLTGVTWTCTATTGGSCAAPSGNGSINTTTVNLLPGSVATFKLRATVINSATGSLVNTATVTSPASVPDPTPANNSDTDSDTINVSADLAITKTNNATSLVAGTQTTYTIIASNAGPSAVVGAAVADSLPVTLMNATWTCTASAGSSCGSANGTGSINATVDLAVGGTATFALTATVVPNTTGNVSNSVSIAAPNGVTDSNGANNAATDTDTVTQTADLSITKTNNATTVTAGTQTTYTIAVHNNGPSTATGASVTDAIPAKLTNATWTCTASAGSTCGTAAGTGDIATTVNLAANGTATFIVTATVRSDATGSLINSASVAAPAGVTDPASGNNTATDTDTVAQTTDLSITKTNNATTVTAGTQTTYTIVVSNAGPSTVTGATITDAIPAKLTNAAWTCTASAGSACGTAAGTGDIATTVNLAANGTATFSVTATVRSDATGSLVNSAGIAAPAGVTDPAPGNNTATDTDTIAVTGDLSITKTNSATLITPGTQTTYTLVVSNAGPSVVTGATVTDNLPATLVNATWTCTASAGSACATPNGAGNISTTVNLMAGGSATFTVTATVSSTASGTLTNTATVAPPAGTTDPNAANNSATANTPLGPSADLSVTKTNNVTSLTPGLPTTYTIVVSNAGPSSVTGAMVTDILPSSLTMVSWTCTASAGSSCSAPNGNVNLNNTAVNLAVGGTATFALMVNVSSAATGSVSNTVNVAVPNGTIDPNMANNSATDTDTLTVTADLAITKTNNSTTVTAGSQITYTIIATNSGPSAVANASVADTLPAALTNATWTCAASAGSACGASNGAGSIATTVNLASGGTATFTLTATVASDAIGTLTNTATISAPGVTDPGGNNSATDADTIISQSNLRVTKTANPSQPIPGTTVTYTIVVTNDGPSPISGATVNDPIPSPLTDAAWTCAASSGSSCGVASGTGNISTTVNLANGGTATFTLTAKIPANVTTSITNTATVTPPTGVVDPEGGNNSGSVTFTPQANSDLTITKTANVSSVRAGDDVVYTINVRNNGPSDATGVQVTDALPVGITLVSATSTKGTCSGTTTITCDIGTLTAAAPNNTAVVTLQVNVPFIFPVGALTNTAVVSSPVTDPTGGNNNGGSTITVTTPPGAQFRTPDISIRTTGTDVCIGGGNVLNMQASLKNTGNGLQRNDPASPEFIALLPTPLTTQTGSCTAFIDGVAAGVCTLTAAQAEWNGEIPAGKTLVITFQVRVRNNVQPGDRFCTDYKVNYDTNSDSVNDAQTVVSDCLTANCTPPPCTGSECPDYGPGGLDKLVPDTGSDQRPGSVLIFPLYTSSASNSTAQNTRISLTNTNAQRPAYLHLFFLDGNTCSVADNFLCLTPNQTTSFLISDLDPGVTGYVIAVAVDNKGCPTNFNYMIGDEYVKLATGHAANLGAEAVPATFFTPPGGTPTDPFICSASANTGTLFFDGAPPTATERHYARLGRVLAADNLPSRADGNDTQIVINRIGGDLGQGADTLGALFGVFYNDTEAAVSFSFSRASCQFLSVISNDFPRTTPRFEQFVPAGRSGWLKLGLPNEGAIVGAVLNSTTNANGYRGGHNLHKLTLGTASLTMPVFPPSCQ